MKLSGWPLTPAVYFPVLTPVSPSGPGKLELFSQCLWGQSGISVPVNRQVGRITRSGLCGVWYHLPSFRECVWGVFYSIFGWWKQKNPVNPTKTQQKSLLIEKSQFCSFFGLIFIRSWVKHPAEKFWLTSANFHCKMRGHTDSDILSACELSESAWGSSLLKTGRAKPIYELSQ